MYTIHCVQYIYTVQSVRKINSVNGMGWGMLGAQQTFTTPVRACLSECVCVCACVCMCVYVCVVLFGDKTRTANYAVLCWQLGDGNFLSLCLAWYFYLFIFNVELFVSRQLYFSFPEQKQMLQATKTNWRIFLHSRVIGASFNGCWTLNYISINGKAKCYHMVYSLKYNI